MNAILPLFVVIPLALAFILPLLEKRSYGSFLSRALAVLASIVLLILAVSLLFSPSSISWIGGWSPSKGSIGISMVLDPLSAMMMVIVTVVALAATLYSLNYMKRFTSEPLFYCLFFLMIAGIHGVVLTGDIFNLYVFLEVAAIASYSLVAFGCEMEELEASFKYLVLGSIGSIFIFLGIGIIYNQTGHLNLQFIRANLPPDNGAVMIAAAFFLTGFSLKAAMVPFHAWLPDAHPSAPAPISAMLSGILIKALGVYTMIRVFFTTMILNRELVWVLITLGAVSMVIGVFLAVGQWDFKRLLAYHSISQMGYVVLSLGVAGEMLLNNNCTVASLALLGGLFHMANHATFKSLLFLCSGAAEYATGVRQLKLLGGLKYRMPVTGACLRIGALSISGIPPFNGFWSKLIIVIAVLQAGHPLLGAMTVLVSFMTLLSFIKVQRYILDGEPSERVTQAREVPVGMQLAMVLLAVICLGAGLLLPVYKDIFFENAGRIVTDSITSTIQLLAGSGG